MFNPDLVVDIKDTATWKIWNNRYQCFVRKLDLIPEGEIRNRGIFTYGNQAQDRDMINERILTYQTVDEMVELSRRGVTITWPKRKDAIKIYELINEHILLWVDYLRWSGMYNAPYDDLIEMDEFACSLHAMVKFDLSSSIDKTIFNERINTLTAFSRSRLNARSAINIGRALTDEELDKAFPKRDSFGELLRQFKIEGGIY